MFDPRPAIDHLPWYALHTVYQHEKTVAQVLTHKGFDILLPLYRSVHQWNDRRKVLDLPLFSCYVFIQGGVDRPLPILMTPGVLGFVSFAGRAARIPENEMEGIRRLAKGDILAEPHPFLRCGDWVRVKSGPLQDVEGILVRKKNCFSLVLSVEILGTSAAVEVDVSAVEHVTRPKSAQAQLGVLRSRGPQGASPGREQAGNNRASTVAAGCCGSAA